MSFTHKAQLTELMSTKGGPTNGLLSLLLLYLPVMPSIFKNIVLSAISLVRYLRTTDCLYSPLD